MKKVFLSLALGLAVILGACTNDATIVSHNISQDADNFKINRRVVFYNGITNDYILSVEGLCSLDPTDRKLKVTCKVGPNEYKRHQLGLSDNVTYFAEHLAPSRVSPHHYKVIFKPSVILPDIEMR